LHQHSRAQPQGIEWFQDSDEKKNKEKACVATRCSASCAAQVISLGSDLVFLSLTWGAMLRQVLHVGMRQQ